MAPLQLRADNSDYNNEQILFVTVVTLSSVLFVGIIWLFVMASRERKRTIQIMLLEQLSADTYTKSVEQRARFEAQLLHASEELEQSKDNAAELQKKVNELEEKVKAPKDDKPAVCDVCGRIQRYMENSPRQLKPDATSRRPLQATVMSAPTSPLWASVSRDQMAR